MQLHNFRPLITQFILFAYMQTILSPAHTLDYQHELDQVYNHQRFIGSEPKHSHFSTDTTPTNSNVFTEKQENTHSTETCPQRGIFQGGASIGSLIGSSGGGRHRVNSAQLTDAISHLYRQNLVVRQQDGPLNHFDRLEVDTQRLDAKQIINEKLQEVHEKSGHSISAPLGTMFTLASQMKAAASMISNAMNDNNADKAKQQQGKAGKTDTSTEAASDDQQPSMSVGDVVGKVCPILGAAINGVSTAIDGVFGASDAPSGGPNSGGSGGGQANGQANNLSGGFASPSGGSSGSAGGHPVGNNPVPDSNVMSEAANKSFNTGSSGFEAEFNASHKPVFTAFADNNDDNNQNQNQSQNHHPTVVPGHKPEHLQRDTGHSTANWQPGQSWWDVGKDSNPFSHHVYMSDFGVEVPDPRPAGSTEPLLFENTFKTPSSFQDSFQQAFESQTPT
ncbi:MAG: hypothetical protein ABFQ95_08085, partial [Pseudomonadota bacterium]